MSARRVAVTGGAGFIGSHVADWLRDQGHEVWVGDDLSGGFRENLGEDIRFDQVDLRDASAAAEWVAAARPEVLYHLAADATEGRSQFTPLSATQRNYVAYLNTLVPALNHGVEKVVFVSSMSVYGAQEPPFQEGLERRPQDIYGIAKAASEHATELLAAVHGFRYTIIRPHNVYGPRQNLSDPYRNVVAIFLNRALQGQPVYIYGDGEQRRSFTYVDDCAPYIARAGLMSETDSETYNVGPVEDVSINQLADAVEAAVGLPLQRQHVPDRPLEVKHAWCTHDKAARDLGYRTSVELREGLRRMVEWVRSVGPQPTRYLPTLEIDSDKAPLTWRQGLI